ncbi:MAG: S41 family peptidase [Schleiferiaceae bacterium]|nr:S41 family peptidase [Schleiferiaceae bacterium]
MKKTLLLPIFLLLCTLPSCEKIIFGEDSATTDPFVNFDYLANEVTRKYAFTEYKQIDLEQLGATYRSKLYEDMPADSLFWVLGDYLNELRDGHVNLISSFNVSRFPFQRLGPQNYNRRLIDDFYLSDRSFITGPFLHDFIADGTIGYIRYSAFTNAVDNNHLNFILNRYANTNGLIIDIRENGGGQTSNGWKILQRFITQPTALLQTRTKNGPNANDFTPLQLLRIDPIDSEEDVKYVKNVVVLTDRGSYSASSIFALGTKALPNVTLVGDTTGGGTGLPNGGQLPNGWTFRMSISQTLEIGTGANFEDGVPPDIYVVLDPLVTHKDEVIERAIQFINQ